MLTFLTMRPNWLLALMAIFGLLISASLSTLLTHIPKTLAYCQSSPLVENKFSIYSKLSFILIGACLSCMIIKMFGLTWITLANIILSFGLLLLLYIDFKHYLLPDSLTLPLLWIGLFCNSFHLFVLTSDAIWGAMIAYLSLWWIANLFKYFRGIEGIGYGDIKLFALFGAWWGIAPLMFIILLASLLGIFVGLLRMIKDSNSLQKPLAFGPYLILAGFTVMFFRSSIPLIVNPHF